LGVTYSVLKALTISIGEAVVSVADELVTEDPGCSGDEARRARVVGGGDERSIGASCPRLVGRRRGVEPVAELHA
jgi:hypothetical protein